MGSPTGQAARPDPIRTFGTSATWVLVGSLTCLVALTWMVLSVGADDLDRWIHTGPVEANWLLRLSGLMSSLGSAPVRAALLTTALAGLAILRRWREAGYVVFVVATVHVIDRFAKALVGRQRLPDPQRGYALAGPARLLVVAVILAGAAWLIGRRSAIAMLWLVPAYLGVVVLQRLLATVPVSVGSDSFPSGHASNTMALLTALAIVRPPGRRWTILALAGLVFVVLVGVSRVTLGFHYPTDVLAGWFLAVSIAMLARPLAGPGREAGSELVQV